MQRNTVPLQHFSIIWYRQINRSKNVIVSTAYETSYIITQESLQYYPIINSLSAVLHPLILR